MTPQEALDQIRGLCPPEAGILRASDIRAILGQLDGPAVDPLPAVPGRGDHVRIVFLLPDKEGGGTIALPALLLQTTNAGLWWSPTDDAPSAGFTPWHSIEAITAEAQP